MHRVIAFCLLCFAGAALDAQPARRAPKAHPAIEAGVECAACHEAESSAWNDSRHGVVLVKCVACHGDPGGTFAAKPAMTTCRSCHPGQVEKATRPCLECHAAHRFALRRAAKPDGGSQ